MRMLVPLLLLGLLAPLSAALDDCRICTDISNAFQDGVKRTAKDNFGGGNTAWEEKSLGSYVFSETRLVDISEGLCKDSGDKSGCHRLVERFEEDIERWWFGAFKESSGSADLRQALCVDTAKFCCPLNHFGASCTQCPQQEGLYCAGRGSCQGNGTREGSGSCLCESGYTGDLCTDCAVNFFNSSSSCLPCHVSCSEGCSGPERTDCKACGPGYTQDPAKGCLDIDECESAPCSNSDEFCENSEGSYACKKCHEGCKGCSGPGDAACKECAGGFEPLDTEEGGQRCQDVNECSVDSPHCRGPHERCVNTPGSFRCDCEDGFQKDPSTGGCVKPPKSEL